MLILSLPFSFAFTDTVIVLSICLYFVVFVCVVGFDVGTAGSVLASPLRYKRCVFMFFEMEEQYVLECLSISLECLFKLECFGRIFDVCFWRMFNYMLNV